MKVTDVLLLTSEWVDEEGSHEIRIYGVSSELGAVEMIFDQHKPVFFIDREETLPDLDFEVERKTVSLETFRGRPVDALYCDTYRDQRNLADRLEADGVRFYEADVRPPDRFLMERFVYGAAKIAGESETKGNLTTFRNPKIKSGPSSAEPTVLSLDIETGVSEDLLYSIGCHLSGPREEGRVFMLGERREDLSDELAIYPSEREVIEAFLAWFREADPDFLIGWFVVGFDLCYLERKCRDLDLTLDLSRTERPILLLEKPGAGWLANVSGRVVIDGIQAVRAAGYTFPNYKLETVARELLGTGKLIASDQNKVAEIERQFREDKASLAKYNLEDCVLVTRLFEKIDLIPLIARRCFFSGLLPDQLNIPNAALDNYMLPKLHRKGLVAPNRPKTALEAHLPAGANRIEAGIHEHVAVLDFVNMVPSLVRIFKIDPLAFAKADVNPQTLPNGRRVSATEHLLPDLFARLTQRAEEAVAKKDHVTRRAIALQMKNYHKVLHSQNNRFYQPILLESLAAVEHWLIGQARDFLEAQGYQVISADAEALFIVLAPGECADPDAAMTRIGAALGNFFEERLVPEYGISSIAAEGKAFYTKMVIDAAGNDKRWAARDRSGGLAHHGYEDLIKEWTDLGIRFRDTLLDRFLRDDDPERWIAEFVAELEGGGFVDELVYTKKIRKNVSEYAKNAPPHIRAARLLNDPGKEISYVWTQRGPVPTSLDHDDIDTEHYIQKQIAPIVDALYALGMRSCQLTYNARNLVGDGCLERTNAGLSDFGVALVDRLNEVGVMIDLSHCGPQTTLEGIEFSKGPVAITHTMCDAVRPGHPRAKSDELIRRCAEKGGVIGMIALGYFVGPDPGGETGIEDYADHIEHAVNIAGIESVGISTDFPPQGISPWATYDEWYVPRTRSFKPSYELRWPPWIPELDSPDRYRKLMTVLEGRGWKSHDIERLYGLNWIRLFGDTIG